MALLRLPYTGRLLASTLIGRLPNAMAPTAVLMAAGQAGSLADGGLLAAGYLVAFAVGQPLWGRLADRIGHLLPLLLCSSLAAAALTCLALSGTSRLPLAMALTVAAGLFNPALEGALRTLWPTVLPGPDAVRATYLRTAYALDNATQESVYAVGPLLAGALTALSPRAALLATAAVGLAGAFSVGCSRPARAWTPARGARHWLGPLMSAPVRVLLATMFCAGAAVGALRVCAVAQAQDSGALWLQGGLPALLSLGGLVGGLLYGARAWPGTHQQHITLLAFGCAVMWLPMLAAPSPPLAGLLVTLPGICFTTMLCVGCLMLNSLAPPGTGTEAFGWFIAAINAGLAVGSALAGMSDGSYLVPLLAAVAAALILSATHDTLSHPPRVRVRPPPKDHMDLGPC
ncbi:MFS transporter [Streptomyces chartreusis]|uniref:MFS transporter n=1 Tax=Streptomyces chartreusis TaxID=1969 RepID=UPI0038671C8B|nr:MFS transporter [Streptomyces chartreusis]